MGLKIKVKITGYKSKEKMLNYYFASLLRLERKKKTTAFHHLERRATLPTLCLLPSPPLVEAF